MAGDQYRPVTTRNVLAAASQLRFQRDNGGCVGTDGANSCSGITQDTW
ncbi:hypothetical protein [Streptomyces sp. NBC_01236]|nr:hypothetical protein OG324_20495 [Streptomyces sp. NBC_01236]